MADVAAPGLLDLLRLAGALTAVIGLVWLFGKLAQRGGVATRGSGSLAVRERIAVSRGVQLLVVAVDGRTLLVGVTGQQVNLVADLSQPGAIAPQEAPQPASAPGTSTAPSLAERLADALRRRNA
jgi:flagellar biogenesis protein FliO